MTTPYRFRNGLAEHRRNVASADAWLALLAELQQLIRNSPKSRRIRRQWTDTRRRTRTRTRSRR